MTALTAFIAFIAILTLIVTRPNATVRDHNSRLPCRATSCTAHRPTPMEQFPRLSRNSWARRDIARMLMTDDDYTGRITPYSRTNHERSE